MDFPDADPPGDAFPPTASEPLVPILRFDRGIGDADALSTWHQALSNGLSSDVPHDLLALWLYPMSGGTVLLGPEALAQDELSVPIPEPQLQPEQLAVLDEIIRDAGYPSTVSLPIRFGRRDVGLMLVASLQAGRYRGMDLMVLRLAAQRLAPSLGRLARMWGGSVGATGHGPERIAGLLDGLAEATVEGKTPQRFAAALSRALEPLIPHDRLELLLAGPGRRNVLPGRRASRRTALGRPVARAGVELARSRRAGGNRMAACCSPMPAATSGGPVATSPWPIPREPSSARSRERGSIGPTQLTTYLLVGSVGSDLYDESDVDLLAKVATLTAPHLALLAGQSARAREREAPPEPAAPSKLLEISETLALGTEPHEATAPRRRAGGATAAVRRAALRAAAE